MPAGKSRCPICCRWNRSAQTDGVITSEAVCGVNNAGWRYSADVFLGLTAHTGTIQGPLLYCIVATPFRTAPITYVGMDYLGIVWGV